MKPSAIQGDRASASVLVKVPRPMAFKVFTEEIDLWWRRGPRFRASGKHAGIIHLEPHVGGRVFESFDTQGGPKVIETGRITVWDPPARVVLTWRAANFKPDEHTQVEVLFAESASGTQVTVIHTGFASLRKDHPVRHGQADAPFVAGIGMFWGALLTALRVHAEQEQIG
jgi:uncharacterized protein YndB with AHSA1/START domain